MKKVFISVFVFLVSLTAFAAPVNIEIFFLPHRPAVAVVEKIEQALTGLDYITIKKYSFDDKAAKKLIDKYNLHDHMPVAVFINGSDTHKANGKDITFRNFPKGDAFVPSFEGVWSYSDIRHVAERIHGEK
ncbi:MAG: hypothetical protein AB7E76_03285 [Deferribacterales bacterium]